MGPSDVAAIQETLDTVRRRIAADPGRAVQQARAAGWSDDAISRQSGLTRLEIARLSKDGSL